MYTYIYIYIYIYICIYTCIYIYVPQIVCNLTTFMCAIDLLYHGTIS